MLDPRQGNVSTAMKVIVILVTCACFVHGDDTISTKNSSSFFVILNHNTNETCEENSTCIRKCCEEGMAMKNKNCTTSDVEFSFSVYDTTQEVSEGNFTFDVVHGKSCTTGRIQKVDSTETGPAHYYVQRNGTLYCPQFRADRVLFYEDYCLENIIFPTHVEFVALLCYRDSDYRQVEETSGYFGMIISMPFLLLTFLVYLIIPEKNLHRKALMFYVICLLLAYVFLVTSNLSKTSFPDVPCHLIGYFIMFFFLGSFLWMNVMCIDMWLTFSGARGYGGTRSTEQKRFLFYCLYAMGAPVMFILFVFLLNTYGDEESIFHPKLGRNKCFLEDGYPQLFYLYLPMAILIGMNIILFILTAIKIQKVKMETAMLKHNDSRKHNYEGDKQQFNLYLKLLFAMGVNWTTEVISWAALWKMQSVPSWIWYLTDLINALYGIFIFFIFVFKKKIWQSLKKRYYVFIGKPHLAQTMVTSTNTRTSHMSSSEVGEYRMSDMRNGRAEERALRP
ncbi:unnamed protein product [Callosobruchus maculatus]|uniref:G-protein coupled receptors family 2 profile 2 domain-containing protein n=1 Tax=Callosobruchus maculatus TaxID=64391 RepID=A0A653BKU1_CALMS|nr:unnamed protein product [Callosobruchus maculatus]